MQFFVYSSLPNDFWLWWLSIARWPHPALSPVVLIIHWVPIHTTRCKETMLGKQGNNPMTNTRLPRVPDIHITASGVLYLKATCLQEETWSVDHFFLGICIIFSRVKTLTSKNCAMYLKTCCELIQPVSWVKSTSNLECIRLVSVILSWIVPHKAFKAAHMAKVFVLLIFS